MDLDEFVRAVPGFAALTHPEKILHFGWFLHTHRKHVHFHQKAIRACYVSQHLVPPYLSKEFARLLERRPRVLLEEGRGYKLEHSTRQVFDQRYGQHETTIVLSQLLQDLPRKLSNEAERIFLSDTIGCYRARLFRPAIIMAWNLTYDHLLRWVLADADRLARFHRSIEPVIGAKRAAGIKITNRDEFQDALPKESEVLKICGHAGLFPSGNIKKILEIQLNKRNLAAHPSLIVIGAPEADDTISSLINNVVLVLK